MAEFPTAVSPPGGASYSAPLMNFSNFANWSADDPYKLPTEKARLDQMQNIAGLQKQLQEEFAKTGTLDYRKAASIIAAMGNPAEAMQMLQQQPAPVSPLISGGPPQGAGPPQAQPAPQAAPTSIPAKPLPPPGPGPQGDSAGSVISRVTDLLPSGSDKIGVVATNVAKALKVDPNAPLTAEQALKAEGMLRQYAQRNNLSPKTADASPSFKDRFGGDSGGSLPPSANAGTPSPTREASLGLGAPAGRTGAPAPPAGGSGVPVPASVPQAAGGQPQGPITPQVALPPGYTDPQQAIERLKQEAVKYAQMPNGAAQAEYFKDWANRIEASIKPLTVGASSTLIDPRTGKTLYQGPAAAAYGSSGGESGATLDADAETYRQTGKLPPNMGRGIQGQQQATAIRTAAAEKEIAEGGDPSEWSTRWQKFATQAAGLRTLENRAAGLTLAENEAKSLIPRVRDISAQVPRTEYPSINKLIQAAKKGTGDPNVIRLGVAVESLIPVYAKILKPVGTVGAADMERAHDILDKAWSNGQINAALDQMELELDSAKTALKKTQEEYGSGAKKKAGEESGATAKGGASSAKSSTFQNTTPDGFGWSIEK
jgi:hypothetical protein